MLPTICGTNTGQHMYLDVGGGNFGAAMSISHTLTGTDARFWQYRINYIPCYTMYTPPHGCLQVRNRSRITTDKPAKTARVSTLPLIQWHMGISGVAKSFNFDGEEIKLQSQYYRSVQSSDVSAYNDANYELQNDSVQS